tara:strand:- start:1199 stop:4096 length:2898 start_codon:yes stop_codon:yes gene_type:complete
MATPANEVQVLADGIQANAPSKGSFALNMLFNNNSWQVRRGFGQVTQFDTQMSSPISGASTEWGFQKHLGSHLIRTNFGNLQLLSVFIADVNTSATGLGSTYSAVDGLYIISIYDLSTNERFEVPLYRHTSQTAVTGSFHDAVPVTTGSRSMTLVGIQGASEAAPQYQTSSGSSYSAWIKAEDEFFYFQEYGDILYFGNSHAGTWAYIPASFNSLRPTTLDRVNTHESAMAYGESSMITPVVLSPGLHPAAFDYARTTDMSNPSASAVVQDRMVYASGKQLFWSDPGYSNAIIVDNIMDVPSEEQITCIAELNSNLVVFTQNETWLYQPSQGDIVTAGRLTRVSDTVGCVGATAFAKVEGSLIWVDTGGVYSTSNGLNVSPMSNDILPFFEGTGMANPVTSYFVSTPVFGHTTLSGEQPRTTLRFHPEGVRCSYMASAKMLVVSVPRLSGALVLSGGKWSWWTFESSVKVSDAGNGIVGATQNIPAPWVLTYQDDMFAVGGPDVQALVDDAEYADGTDLNNDTTDRSFFILEYGRGGAIDRSITDEDDRKITGVGVVHNPSGTGAIFGAGSGGVFFHDPVKVPIGYKFPVSREAATPARDYILIPVTVVLPQSVWDPGASPPEGVDDITIRLTFDRTRWEPVFTGTDANIDLLFPTERLGSVRASGAHPPWVVATYSDATYATQSTTGAFFQARWIGSRSACYHNPHMNLNEERHNHLMFLPFKRTASNVADDTSAMAWSVVVDSGNSGVILDDSANSILRRVRLYVFRRWSLGSGSVRKDDSVAQPVDWAYKSTNVGLEEGKELKMRGTWSNILSHGSATDKVISGWPYGLFNTLVGSDRKEWIAQIVDLSPTQAAVEQQDRTSPFESTQTLRTRVQKSDGSLTNKVFQTGGTDITWGDPSTQATGNLLIGDQDTSEISTSMSVKGQSFSVMVFGFIMNRAERLMVEGIKAAVRVVGGRRRRGR